MDAFRVLLLERPHLIRRTVGRAVVDDEDVQVLGLAEDECQHLIDILRLIVCGNDNEGTIR
jgi:hypothetical protein